MDDTEETASDLAREDDPTGYSPEVAMDGTSPVDPVEHADNPTVEPATETDLDRAIQILNQVGGESNERVIALLTSHRDD